MEKRRKPRGLLLACLFCVLSLSEATDRLFLISYQTFVNNLPVYSSYCLLRLCGTVSQEGTRCESWTVVLLYACSFLSYPLQSKRQEGEGKRYCVSQNTCWRLLPFATRNCKMGRCFVLFGVPFWQENSTTPLAFCIGAAALLRELFMWLPGLYDLGYPFFPNAR